MKLNMGAAKPVITLTASWARAMAIALGGVTVAMSGNYALAEIVPDGTLGSESSVVIPNTTVRGEIGDLIEGGAKRGANLFHSFGEFNVGELQRVYFANPSGIESILTRVTGSNLSNILGTLGVDGPANLFLLNPNGIVFGAQSRLDVAGSFVASTANSLVFGNGLEFSATSPEAPPLLTINITPGLQYGKYDPRTRIQNAGNLAVGQDLTLAAGNLDLQGQLEAGRDLTLFGEDTVSIRDSVAQPFIANAGGLLLIQGNQLIDIAAHNHTDSGLFAGSDLRLRSHNPVAGDAHYTAGGSFSIEQLDGNPGNLLSPYDPIILANGDVSLGNYTGASLHILAGGSVTVGDLEINSTDTADNAISPNNSNPFLASLANVTLSDQAGTSVVIDGSNQPTLDIRAGIDWTLLGGFPGNTDTGNLAPNFGTAATSADITIGDISIQAPNGLVFLTNQYQPNGSNPTNTLEIGTLRTDDDFGGFVGNSGDVIIDYRGGIEISVREASASPNRINTSSATGNAGQINLITLDDITLENSDIITSTSNAGQAGDITIETGSFTARRGARIRANSNSQADGGDITITASGAVSIDGRNGTEANNNGTELVSRLDNGGIGKSGDITIKGDSVSVTESAVLDAGLRGEGSAGNINIEARQVIFEGAPRAKNSRGNENEASSEARVNVERGASGQGGTITIKTESLSILDGARLSADLNGTGTGGNIEIDASDSVTVSETTGNRFSRIRSNVGEFVRQDAVGNGGNITIRTGSLSLTQSGQIEANTNGRGDAGQITIVADDTVTLEGQATRGRNAGIVNNIERNGTGDSGGISITTGSLFINQNGSLESRIRARDEGERNGGDITIIAEDQVILDKNINSILTQVNPDAIGDAGKTLIEAESVTISNGARVVADTLGKGNAGEITIKARETVTIDGIASNGNISSGLRSRVGPDREDRRVRNQSKAEGQGGEIKIEAKSVFVTNGGQVSTEINDIGDAGDISIIAEEEVIFDGAAKNEVNGEENVFSSIIFSRVRPQAEGDGGKVSIEAGSVSFTNGALINSQTRSTGKGGDITIKARDRVLVDGFSELIGAGSGIFSDVQSDGEGDGGNIEIQANSIEVTDRGRIRAGTSGRGDGGNINLTGSNTVTVNNGVISSAVNQGATGTGGDIEITTSSLSLINGGRVEAGTLGVSQAVLDSDFTNQSYQEFVLADQPVAYWRLDETTSITAVDSSGNGFDGTYRNGVTQGVPGISGTAGEFDGNNDAVDVGIIAPGSELDISNKSFTVEAWVKPDELKEQSYVGIHPSNNRNDGDGDSLYFRVTSNGSVRFGDFPDDLETLNNVIEPDTWYHIVATYDQISDRNTIFVNGKRVTGNDQGAFEGQDPRFLIGAWRNIGDQAFNGVIDEVAVYDKALSPESITSHFLLGQLNLGVSPESFSERAANAGNIKVKADDITISGVSPTKSDLASGLVSSSSGNFSGVAGEITIDTDSLKVEERGEINVSSQTAQAGGITINTNSLKVEERGIITVSSKEGRAGNLDITANSLLLNKGRLFAETAENLDDGTSAADIILNISDLIQLKNESLISAEALSSEATGGNITGGNITINNNPFLIVFPPTGSNGSDIIARAPEGQGGNITINAFSIFGDIEERKAIPDNGTNDIDASGTTDGVVNINTENDFLEREPNSLPTDPAQPQFDQRCQPSNSTGSRFINTGRGGIPPRPGEISSNSPWEDIRRPTTRGRYRSRTALVKPPVQPPTTPKPKRIIEAQGIMIDAEGNIFLTAYPTTVTPDGFRQVPGSCYLR
ncbi:MAG: filamentous hemagglutinin N-terminal domain-containing protein [Moorea sp. SIOASIH]|uniref:two-partner secretion domain-containing protein n=1 Tax=Moorena sp. SIOASIH TaxID=2607817 RepID=UPI0013BA6FC1|nr:LamG-like jellyroll fold domain-containing protein [Moorena sp. SIOASIH]NEO37071.1 filamentous hemagglutinin N-terminal domain-containing protein [Moorena sp. SIOASIH]